MAQYIVAYILEEVSRYCHDYGSFDVEGVVYERVYDWIRQAVEAYEGGAR